MKIFEGHLPYWVCRICTWIIMKELFHIRIIRKQYGWELDAHSILFLLRKDMDGFSTKFLWWIFDISIWIGFGKSFHVEFGQYQYGLHLDKHFISDSANIYMVFISKNNIKWIWIIFSSTFCFKTIWNFSPIHFILFFEIKTILILAESDMKCLSKYKPYWY